MQNFKINFFPTQCDISAVKKSLQFLKEQTPVRLKSEENIQGIVTVHFRNIDELFIFAKLTGMIEQKQTSNPDLISMENTIHLIKKV